MPPQPRVPENNSMLALQRARQRFMRRAPGLWLGGWIANVFSWYAY